MKPQPYGGDRSAVMGHQDFSPHGGRSAPTYFEDTGAAMQPHMDQKLFEQQFGNRQPAAGQPYDRRRSPPYIPQDQFSSPGMMQHRPTAGEIFLASGDINTIEAMKRSSGLVTSGQRAEEMVLHSELVVITAEGKEAVSCKPISSATEVGKGQRVVVCRTNSTEYGTVRAVNVTIDGKRGFVLELSWICQVCMCIMHKKCYLMSSFLQVALQMVKSRVHAILSG